MSTVIIPKANEDELAEFRADFEGKLAVRLVETADEAFAVLFGENEILRP
jgi:predicted ATP-dependent protease